MERFTSDKIHYFKAKLGTQKSFDVAVQWFQANCGLRRSQAIMAARAVRPDLYNQWRANQNPNVNHLHRDASSSQSASRPANASITALSMRTSTGAPLVRFVGL